MGKLIAFNHVTLDGYFTDKNGDMSWAHRMDPEWNAFVAENASSSGGGVFLFGRVTYQMMAGYWPTPMAIESNPVVAERMNSAPKVVFSRTLDSASWNNTRLVKENMAAEVRKLKEEREEGLMIFGSGTIVSQLAQGGLIDEYQLVLNPLVLGKGRTLFETLEERLTLELTKSRTFGNGNVFLTYERAMPGR